MARTTLPLFLAALPYFLGAGLAHSPPFLECGRQLCHRACVPVLVSERKWERLQQRVSFLYNVWLISRLVTVYSSCQRAPLAVREAPGPPRVWFLCSLR